MSDCYDDWTEWLDADELDELMAEPVPATAAEMVGDRLTAVLEVSAAVDAWYDCDEPLGSPSEMAGDLARMALVNGRRTCLTRSDRLAANVRQLAALHYRRQARAAVRMVCSSQVWDDRALLTAVLSGRQAVTTMLRHETDAERRAVLELALSILDQLDPGTVDELVALLETSNATPAGECAHRRRRRRAGPCLARPRLSHASSRSDDPYPPHREVSQPFEAISSHYSLAIGGAY